MKFYLFKLDLSLLRCGRKYIGTASALKYVEYYEVMNVPLTVQLGTVPQVIRILMCGLLQST